MTLLPSLLSAPLMDLKNVLTIFEKNKVELAHMDVMDGHYVPNLSYGPDFLNVIEKESPLKLDVHLMINCLDALLPRYFRKNVSTISIHPEAHYHPFKLLQMIKDQGIRAGVALNPGTAIDILKPLEPLVDHVLIMSVNPGFGGQKFIQSTYEKIKNIRNIFGNRWSVAVDGGVDIPHIPALKEAGATQFIAGSSFFNGEDLTAQIKRFHEVIHA
jgi:ribulose-phosphate 3-epimerase